MTTISADDVRHVARLSRLALDETQVDAMAAELDSIIDSIGKIAELDLADVRPTTHALDLTNTWMPDEPHQSITPEAALRNAPDPREDGFGVPRMQS
jgi:aspartyl-tRNA(Asn)/glutamyl-tRNA(Gln) amidotransferase subunit C